MLSALLLATTLWTGPSIQQVSPSVGRVEGGETIRIQGTNFGAPIRVLFADENQSIEGLVAEASSTHLGVITPPWPMNGAQSKSVTVVVHLRAGTPSETTLRTEFLFEKAILQPHLLVAAPNRGTTTGGMRVSLFGEAFQSPVRVFFGAAEARVLFVERSRILVEAPPGTVGRTSIRVDNIVSGTTTELASAFRYHEPPRIRTIAPGHAPLAGGTRVTIRGEHFFGPVVVILAGVAAEVVSMTETEIVAIAGPSRTAIAGPAIVIDVSDGTITEGRIFTYGRVVRREP